MRKITLGLILCHLALQSFADHPPLEGYSYASVHAPSVRNGNRPKI